MRRAKIQTLAIPSAAEAYLLVIRMQSGAAAFGIASVWILALLIGV